MKVYKHCHLDEMKKSNINQNKRRCHINDVTKAKAQAGLINRGSDSFPQLTLIKQSYSYISHCIQQFLKVHVIIKLQFLTTRYKLASADHLIHMPQCCGSSKVTGGGEHLLSVYFIPVNKSNNIN